MQFIILTWSIRSRRFETITVSRMTVPGGSMRFRIGSSYFAFASIGRSTWTIVSMKSKTKNSIKLVREVQSQSFYIIIWHVPFLDLSRIYGWGCSGQTFSTYNDLSSARNVGKTVWSAASRWEIATSLKFLLQSQVLSRSETNFIIRIIVAY